MKAFDEWIDRLSREGSQDLEPWRQVLETVQDLSARLGEAGAFTVCLASQNVKDEQAKILQGRLSQTGAAFRSTMTQLDRLLLEMPNSRWEALLQHPEIQPIAFPLAERRQRAAEKLPADMESLAGDLAVDGY